MLINNSLGQLISKRWNPYLEFFSPEDKDIYFREEYVKLYESKKDTAECYVYQKDEKVLLFPYLKRKIDLLEDEYYDFETAYGYGGPIANTKDEHFCREAWLIFEEFCQANNIVCGFIRFHPLLINYELFQDKNFLMKIYFNRPTIGIDLAFLESSIYTGVLRNVRKAENSNLRFAVDDNLENINEFINIYRITMESVKADSFYFFSSEYYKKIKLNRNAFLGLVYSGSMIISAAIFFHFGVYGHYHLGGSLREYLPFRPNDLLFYKTALYLREKGVKIFHLGGGVSQDINDSLLRFKRKLSDSEYNFYVGKTIFNKRIYDEICKKWEEEFPEKSEKYKNFFLRYRY